MMNSYFRIEWDAASGDAATTYLRVNDVGYWLLALAEAEIFPYIRQVELISIFNVEDFCAAQEDRL